MVTLVLSRDNVGQMLDGLGVRRDDWRYTQRYLEEGYMELDRIIEECSDADEAKSIADTYDDIIAKIREQLK